MADEYIGKNSAFIATADAIREKGESADPVTWDEETGFEQAVLAINGGGDLNFEVVGGTTRPTNPVENTIWANTDTEITGWAFSAETPDSPTDGMVWFFTAPNSSVKFDAFNKNSMIITPMSAFQYISGVWAKIDSVEIYQNDIWKLWTVYLYNAGYENNVITGGWGLYNATSGKWAKGADEIVASYSGSSYTQGCIYTTNPVDVRGYSSLCIEVEHTSGDCKIGLTDRTDYLYCFQSSFYSAYTAFSSTDVHRCTLSNTQTDTLRVVVGGAWIGKIKKIWLE